MVSNRPSLLPRASVREMPLSLPSPSLLAPPPRTPRDQHMSDNDFNNSDDDSDSSGSPERDIDDDGGSVMAHNNDSQSSLGVSLEDMELDAEEIDERCRRSPICRLPAELLISIFSKLQSPHDIRNCMLTCKSWARNSVDLLWHKPTTEKWEQLLKVMGTIGKHRTYFAYGDLIKRINLAKLGRWVSDGVILQLTPCKRIERLTLTDCHRASDLSLVPLISGNRSLLAIDISGCDNVSNASMRAVAANCYKLQGLNITKCRKITDSSLIEVAKNCRRIKRLKLNECSQITDVAVLAFADFCHDMIEIDLHKVFEITDVSVTALMSQGSQMRELRMAHCSQITDQAFLSLPPDRVFDYLRILDLTDCNELGDAGLQHIIHAAPKLRNLVLAKCRNLTDRGIMAIAKLSKNLHYIHLGHCSQITDYGVNHLTRHCNRIRYIDLACCSNLTDESVKQLALLPKLKRIGLVKCNNISDVSIRALAAPKPLGSNGTLYPNILERLHLSYCVHLTIKAIRLMLINCPKLSHLSLTGVPEFLRDDLLRFCRDAPIEFNDHQRELFCVFSGEGVDELRRHLKMNYPSPTDSDIEVDEAGGMPGNVWNPYGYVLQQAVAHANQFHGRHDHGPPLAYNPVAHLHRPLQHLNGPRQAMIPDADFLRLQNPPNGPPQLHPLQHYGPPPDSGNVIAGPAAQHPHPYPYQHQNMVPPPPPPPPQPPAHVPHAIADDGNDGDVDEDLGDEGEMRGE